MSPFSAPSISLHCFISQVSHLPFFFTFSPSSNSFLCSFLHCFWLFSKVATQWWNIIDSVNRGSISMLVFNNNKFVTCTQRKKKHERLWGEWEGIVIAKAGVRLGDECNIQIQTECFGQKGRYSYLYLPCEYSWYEYFPTVFIDIMLFGNNTVPTFNVVNFFPLCFYFPCPLFFIVCIG